VNKMIKVLFKLSEEGGLKEIDEDPTGFFGG
jgi:hypothetical protein